MEHIRFYQDRIDTLTRQIRSRKTRNRSFVAGEIVTFIAFIGFIVLYTVRPDSLWPLGLSALSLAAYFFVRHMDIKNSEATEWLKDLRSVNEHEMQYLRGDFSPFDDGARYVNPHHPFSFDLDIFGAGSLYQRINRSVTTGGSDLLAEWLQSVEYHADTEATRFMSEQHLWREAFMAVGQRGKIDTGAIWKALETVRNMPLPQVLAGRGTLIMAWAAIIGLLTTIALAVTGIVSAQLPIWWGVLQFFTVYLACMKNIRLTSRAVSTLHRPLKRCMQLITVIDKQYNDHWTDDALASFRQLERILNDLDRRGNVLGMITFNMFMLSDLFIIRKFLRWQRHYVKEMDFWLSMVSVFDAQVGMATFRYNEPETVYAEVTSDDESVIVEARGMWHPFLGTKAVKNDFDINDRNFYIITGANMAGKSTFLRTLGINYVLAMNGLPVFAKHLRVSRFHLFTSMRTTDDLNHGISYFNAELLRLRQLIDSLDNRPTLIILDEILKGTNSLDKLNGSRMFLEWIAQRNVTGVIATHDLELSKMEGEQFHNFCFEIALGEDVTYSYKLTPGVARNQNATFLLRKILS